MENPTHSSREKTLCFCAYKNRKLKQNSDELKLAKEKRGQFLYCLFRPKETFLTCVFYLNV